MTEKLHKDKVEAVQIVGELKKIGQAMGEGLDAIQLKFGNLVE